MRCLSRALTAVALAAVLVGPGAHSASAGSTVSRPVIGVDRSEVAVGEVVTVTIDGFVASSVTLSMCGNGAYRGSGDCNMPASRGIRLDRDGSPTQVEFTVAEPPEPCPCVIRASSASLDEIAVVPIRLIGHGVSAPRPSSQVIAPLTITVAARPAPTSAIEAARKALGGPSRYDVTVAMNNASAATVDGASVVVTAQRGDDDIATVDLDDVQRVEPGQTLERTISIEVPALTFGDVTWTAAASSAFPTVEASSVTSYLPVPLFALAALLTLDLGVLAARLWRRARQRRAGAGVRADRPSTGRLDLVFDGQGGGDGSGSEPPRTRRRRSDRSV